MYLIQQFQFRYSEICHDLVLIIFFFLFQAKKILIFNCCTHDYVDTRRFLLILIVCNLNQFIVITKEIVYYVQPII